MSDSSLGRSGSRLVNRIRRSVHGRLSPRVTQLLRGRGVIGNPYLAAKFVPSQGDHPWVVTLQPDQDPAILGQDGLPVPPRERWENYGETAEQYLESGKQHTRGMLAVLEQQGITTDRFSKVLDFGCGAGRMLRWFPRSQSVEELWGVDIQAAHITWCQQHLGPPFLFATTTTVPHLPFEDNSFDFVYCGSVFTHISDLADAWFLELRRVVRTSGFLYISIHDKHALDLLITRYREGALVSWLVDLIQQMDASTSVLSKNYAWFSIGADPETNVFYDADYLVKKWSRLASVLSVTPEAYGYQTAILLRK